MKQVLLVFLGGGFGSAARFLLGKLWNNPESGFPYGTFAANVMGSFFIGIILGLAAKNETLTQSQTLLLATGFCGGFTTFSTFAYENHIFLKQGDLMTFALYTVASFVTAFLAVFLGIYLSRAL
ncbi:MAG: fluoride efflux transporter CrcB [Flavobacteriales bacterium]|nr:fluoride efflux transporter CrcB [Flavobacteriales bacterium]